MHFVKFIFLIMLCYFHCLMVVLLFLVIMPTSLRTVKGATLFHDINSLVSNLDRQRSNLEGGQLGSRFLHLLLEGIKPLVGSPGCRLLQPCIQCLELQPG